MTIYICEDNNILVMLNSTIENYSSRKLDLNEFRAFILLDNYSPLIFINNKDSYNGKLFSLLHELVHLYLGENDLFNLDESNLNDQKSEYFCNEVAAELLVPENLIKEFYNSETNNLNKEIETLAKKFNCSVFVILNRLNNLRLILYKDYNYLYKLYSNKLSKQFTKQKEKSGGSPYSVLKNFKYDSNFIKALNQSVLEGQTTLTDALYLTRTNLKTYNQLVEKNNAR